MDSGGEISTTIRDSIGTSVRSITTVTCICASYRTNSPTRLCLAIVSDACTLESQVVINCCGSWRKLVSTFQFCCCGWCYDRRCIIPDVIILCKQRSSISTGIAESPEYGDLAMTGSKIGYDYILRCSGCIGDVTIIGDTRAPIANINTADILILIEEMCFAFQVISTGQRRTNCAITCIQIQIGIQASSIKGWWRLVSSTSRDIAIYSMIAIVCNREFIHMFPFAIGIAG